jgi:hypothetical protein
MVSNRKYEYEENDKIGECVFLREFASVNKKGETIRMAECICKCGKVFKTRLHSVKEGTKCGCTVGKQIRLNKKTGLRYDQSTGKKKSEYWIWNGMLSRCRNVNNKDYKHYGGRGIGVASEWNTFKQFFLDMGDKPSSKHSLDRIDNSKDYSKDNCRWSDQFEQASNKRTNRQIEFEGEVMIMKNWSRRTGIPVTTISRRLKNGWTIEKSLTTKPYEFSLKSKNNEATNQSKTKI